MRDTPTRSERIGGVLCCRADGIGTTGSGHVVRQLALAEAWTDQGGEAMLATKGCAPWAETAWAAEGAAVIGLDGPPSPPAWLSFDGYDLGPEIERASSGASRVLVVGDHGVPAPHAADLRLDQNLDTERTTAGVLAGPRYALLRREHRRPPRREVSKEIRQVLLTLGGAPPTDTLERLSSVIQIVLPDAELRVATIDQPITDMANVLATTDLAISAAGSTTWELLAWGVPAALVSIASNQDPVLASVVEAGLAIDLMGDADPESALSRLAADVELRRTMVAAGQALVDGDGARRVVAAMLAKELRPRPVRAQDARLLWEWANDPVVRVNSISSEPIAWDDHVRWMDKGLTSGDRFAVIIESAEGEALAQVRFDGLLSDKPVDIGVSIAANARGRGLGSLVILAALEALEAAHSATDVRALIKPSNVASLRSFDLAGFSVTGEVSVRGVALMELHRSPWRDAVVPPAAQ